MAQQTSEPMIDRITTNDKILAFTKDAVGTFSRLQISDRLRSNREWWSPFAYLHQVLIAGDGPANVIANMVVELEVQAYVGGYKGGASGKEFCEVLACLPALERLSVDGAINISDQNGPALTFLGSIPNLTTFQLTLKGPESRWATIFRLLEALPRLRTLEIYLFTDSHSWTNSPTAPFRLTDLVIGWRTPVFNGSISFRPMHAPSVGHLKNVRVHNADPDLVHELIETHGSNLELFGCTRTDRRALVASALVKLMTKLVELDICGYWSPDIIPALPSTLQILKINVPSTVDTLRPVTRVLMDKLDTLPQLRFLHFMYMEEDGTPGGLTNEGPIFVHRQTSLPYPLSAALRAACANGPHGPIQFHMGIHKHEMVKRFA